MGETLPEVFYHGSLYKQKELMPGIKRTGKLVVWDGVESNINLYVTTDYDTAVRLAIGSATEKEFESNRFMVVEGDIYIFSNQEIKIDDLLKLELYVYTIKPKPNEGWVKNNNKYNNIDTEWLTTKTIYPLKVEQIDIRKVMAGKNIVLTTAPADVSLKALAREYASSTKVFKIKG